MVDGGTEEAGERSAGYRSLVTDPTLLAMMLVAFVVMFGYEVPAPILSRIGEGVGVSDAEVGLVMTAFAVPGVLFVPVTGLLADLYGRKRVLVPSLVLFAAAGLATVAADAFTVVLGLRALQGLAFAGILPISVVVLGDAFDAAEGSAAQGFRTSAAGAAVTVVPPIAGFLAGYGWNVPFLLFGLGFLVAAVVFLAVPETGEALETDTGVTETLRGYATGVRVELADGDLGVFVVGGFVRGFVRLAVLTFVPLFAVRTLDASLVEAGFVLSARGIARLVLPPFAGVVTGRFSRTSGLAGALGVGAASCALVPFAPSILWAGVLVFGFTVGDSFVSPLLKDAVASRAGDDHRAGVINSMYVFQNGGEAVSPALFGVVLAAGGFVPVFLLGAAVMLVYLVAVLVVGR
ncbi:MAG: MFS transporter [Haloarculaceae archaeon]